MWGREQLPHIQSLSGYDFSLNTFANDTLLVLFFQCSPAAKLQSFIPSNVLRARPILFIPGCGFSFSLQRAAQGSRQHTETSSWMRFGPSSHILLWALSWMAVLINGIIPHMMCLCKAIPERGSPSVDIMTQPKCKLVAVVLLDRLLWEICKREKGSLFAMLCLCATETYLQTWVRCFRSEVQFSKGKTVHRFSKN